jgi:hypothetical protein
MRHRRCRWVFMDGLPTEDNSGSDFQGPRMEVCGPKQKVLLENTPTLATMKLSRTWGTRRWVSVGLFGEDLCDGSVAVVEDLFYGASDEDGSGYGAE